MRMKTFCATGCLYITAAARECPESCARGGEHTRRLAIQAGSSPCQWSPVRRRDDCAANGMRLRAKSPPPRAPSSDYRLLAREVRMHRLERLGHCNRRARLCVCACTVTGALGSARDDDVRFKALMKDIRLAPGVPLAPPGTPAAAPAHTSPAAASAAATRGSACSSATAAAIPLPCAQSSGV